MDVAAVDELDKALSAAYAAATRWTGSLPDRPVGPSRSAAQLLADLDEELPEEPTSPADVVASLAASVEPGLSATGSGRFFGFVVGGALPAALAADWLTSTWDQNAVFTSVAPAEAAVEHVAARWVLDLLGLPGTASVGFTTGATMANFTCLAAARHRVLADAGWDVEVDGLSGAPGITVVAGADRHVSVDAALRYLGVGTAAVVPVPTDDQGRVLAREFTAALDAARGPTIACLQVGNVNTGGCDPVAEVLPAARRHGAWVHVDGAFGLWAAANPATRHLVAGVHGADSWATDAHKWLNVPYDCGLAVVADRRAHASAMGAQASYFTDPDGTDPLGDQLYTVPEVSRRGRGFPVYAALRSLGRQGVADLVGRCCALAQRFATGVATIPGAKVLNDVTLNQVLVAFPDDATTGEVLRRLQEDGTAYLTGTVFRGAVAIRMSVSSWSTTAEDIDVTLDAVRRIAGQVTRRTTYRGTPSAATSSPT